MTKEQRQNAVILELNSMYLHTAKELMKADERSERCYEECARMNAILNWIKAQDWFDHEAYQKVARTHDTVFKIQNS